MQSSLHKYGSSDQQVVSFHQPGDGGAIHGTAVLVHGGYWREAFTAELMVPLAADLVMRGWAVANVEYRRVGQAPAPSAMVNDVSRAVQCALDWCAESGNPRKVVGIGHSVGAQLGMLNGGLLDAFVALAPVTDLPRAYREDLGESAVKGFIGDDAGDLPARLERYSPVHQLPLGKPLLVVHGSDDQRVPVAHSKAYCAKATSLGDAVDFWQLPHLDHLQAINPDGIHWPQVVEWMHARQADQSA
ncbi:prolyl oligopeptidase family serine peptidase [Arthrobacter sp. AK01]|uniref:alpha/beta hydrolase family protein n=1 Tax=Arthrobacter sp. AK01 TaxID=2894084 RepID=UPI001E5B0EE5|nr:prolyl oligopeptidase family serine peptidase [Arthrobacter sp. AK01]MCD4851389.1 prolyl oligopeptidase family serine peptidase [Arthrobacter sp. AK01]